MAFSIKVSSTLEYRGFRSGFSEKTGKQWMSLMFEDGEAQQLSISVPNDMIGDVYQLGMRKGDMYEVDFRAVARADGNSFIMLNAVPTMVGDEY